MSSSAEHTIRECSFDIYLKNNIVEVRKASLTQKAQQHRDHGLDALSLLAGKTN